MRRSPDPKTEAVDEPTESDRHRILADPRRHVLLDVLAERAEPIQLAELSAAVADREAEAETGNAADRDRIAVSLHHHHLPLLADLGAVAYDPAANCVEAVYWLPEP